MPRGDVAAVKIVDDTDDLILISANGILIRMHADDINIQSRYGGGVRVMRLAADDKVAMVARVDRDNGAVTEKPEEEGDAEPTAEELAAMEAQEGRRRPPPTAPRPTTTTTARNKPGKRQTPDIKEM